MRSSIHFTGRPSSRAAAHTATSSRPMPAFCPNAAADVAAADPQLVGRLAAGCVASAGRSACGAWWEAW